MDLFVKALPIHDMGHPSETLGGIKNRKGDLPRPEEWIDDENVPG